MSAEDGAAPVRPRGEEGAAPVRPRAFVLADFLEVVADRRRPDLGRGAVERRVPLRLPFASVAEGSSQGVPEGARRAAEGGCLPR